MDKNPAFRMGMVKAFETVGLAPIVGSVMLDQPVMFRRWTGVDKNVQISARGCALLSKLLARQCDKQITIGDLADDSNFVSMNYANKDVEECESENDVEESEDESEKEE